MSLTIDYEVVVVGGGIVGLTLASLLGEEGFSVAIIETKAPWTEEEVPQGVDLRVSALSHASEHILDAAGAWEHIARHRISPFREMHVWDALGGGVIHFDSADIGEDRLGDIIENRVIESALLERVQALETVVLYRPAELKAMTLTADHVSLTLTGGQRITTMLVVGADGADSRVRQIAGMKTLQWSYDQQAVVATIETSESHREIAWQVFLPTGPLAFLPLPGNHSAIVWSTTEMKAEYLQVLDDDLFLAELQIAFGTALGRMLSTGPRAAYPLRAIYATSYVQPRIALAGDAAHSIHPLAGQGVNLGLLDAAALAQIIAEGRSQDKGSGSFKQLRRYERWRKGDNALMLGTMEAFHRLFRTEFTPVRWLRSWGLNLTHSLTPVKNLLMRHAVGITGELPRAARGPVF